MKNILLWAGIAVLAFQDYFKQQPVKPTRRQQFLQTGGTSQAFIEGTEYTYSSVKKQLIKMFGKPNVEFKRSDATWYIELSKGKIAILLVNKKSLQVQMFYKPYDEDEFMIKHNRFIPYWKQTLAAYRLNDYDIYQYILETVLKYCIEGSDNEDYRKLYEMANAGDWELALEIAKGQGLL